MRSWFDSGLRGLAAFCVMSLVSAVQPVGALPQDRAPLRQIGGTTLKVDLPPDWRLEAAPAGAAQLKHSGNPEFALTVSQTTPKSMGHSCIDLLGSMQAIPALNARVVPRPAFVPDVYFGSALEVSTTRLTCLSTGDGLVSIMIRLATAESRPDALTPMLLAIAEAGMKQSQAISSPGKLKLPLLGVEIAIRNGTWGVQSGTDAWGTHNILGRVAQRGRNEIYITPFVFKEPGRCESLLRNPQFSAAGGAALAKGRNYGGTRWYADAVEQFPPPFKALQAYACRNVGTNSVLMARIDYEKAAVTREDLPILRQLLDDIGDEVDRKQGGK